MCLCLCWVNSFSILSVITVILVCLLFAIHGCMTYNNLKLKNADKTVQTNNLAQHFSVVWFNEHRSL